MKNRNISQIFDKQTFNLFLISIFSRSSQEPSTLKPVSLIRWIIFNENRNDSNELIFHGQRIFEEMCLVLDNLIKLI